MHLRGPKVALKASHPQVHKAPMVALRQDLWLSLKVDPMLHMVDLRQVLKEILKLYLALKDLLLSQTRPNKPFLLVRPPRTKILTSRKHMETILRRSPRNTNYKDGATTVGRTEAACPSSSMAPPPALRRSSRK